MIYGIGTDIVKVDRFNKWIENEKLCDRFFNEKELSLNKDSVVKCEHYASRFAAKEAFSKALGTGLKGFNLKEVFVTKDENGKPLLNFAGDAKKLLQEKCGNCNVHLSLSHEKEFAVAFVVIEQI